MREKNLCNLKDFVEEIAEELRMMFFSQDSFAITPMETLLNNQTIKYTLQIKEEGRMTSPNFYMEDYYEEYSHGRSFTDIVLDIKERYEKFSEEYGESYHLNTDREWVETHIIYRLVNKDANEKKLQKSPYMEIADLAAIFYLLVEQKECHTASIQIDYRFLEYIGLAEKELMPLAENNCKRLFPIYFAPITESICHFDGNPENAYVYREEDKPDMMRQRHFLASVIQKERENPLFVLTNANGINGAAVILYPGVLPQLAQIFDSSFYIIPSSVHEVLVFPEYGADIKEINKMIHEVNSSMLKKEEVLSEHAYLYDAELGKLVNLPYSA